MPKPQSKIVSDNLYHHRGVLLDEASRRDMSMPEQPAELLQKVKVRCDKRLELISRSDSNK